jgi:hypothetical protein
VGTALHDRARRADSVEEEFPGCVATSHEAPDPTDENQVRRRVVVVIAACVGLALLVPAAVTTWARVAPSVLSRLTPSSGE